MEIFDLSDDKAETEIVVPTSKTSVVKKPASTFDPAENYLKKTNQPAARRDLIEMQKDDINLSIFAKSNLIAKSWLQNDPVATEAIFAEMIDDINRGAMNVTDALLVAEERVRKTEIK